MQDRPATTGIPTTTSDRAPIYANIVHYRDCPEGDWQPHIGWKFHEREQKWEAWWVSPWPDPFMGGNPTGLPGGTLDNAMPGTWIAPPWVGIIVDSKDQLQADVERGPVFAIIRLWRVN